MFGILALFASSIQGLEKLETVPSEKNGVERVLVKEEHAKANTLPSDDVSDKAVIATNIGIEDASEYSSEDKDMKTTIINKKLEDRVLLQNEVNAKEADGPNTQQLVFGSYHKDSGVEVHYCDVLLKPQRTISSVTVFLKTEEGGKDSAVPKCTITPKSSPNKGFVRLELNDPSIERNESVYNFQITCSDGTILHTESWTFDEKTGKFSHASAVKRPFYKKKLFRYIAGGVLCVVLCALSFAIYRSIRKSKSTI